MKQRSLVIYLFLLFSVIMMQSVSAYTIFYVAADDHGEYKIYERWLGDAGVGDIKKIIDLPISVRVGDNPKIFLANDKDRFYVYVNGYVYEYIAASGEHVHTLNLGNNRYEGIAVLGNYLYGSSGGVRIVGGRLTQEEMEQEG